MFLTKKGCTWIKKTEKMRYIIMTLATDSLLATSQVSLITYFPLEKR